MCSHQTPDPRKVRRYCTCVFILMGCPVRCNTLESPNSILFVIKTPLKAFSDFVFGREVSLMVLHGLGLRYLRGAVCFSGVEIGLSIKEGDSVTLVCYRNEVTNQITLTGL